MLIRGILNSAFLSLLVFLTACGGGSSGGSSGVSGPATITADNKEDLALAASLAAAEVKSVDDAPASPFGGVMSVSAEVYAANDLVLLTYELSTLPSGVDASQICTSGGTASVESNNSQTTVIYNNCDLGGVVASGTATIVTSGETITITYRNFSITVDGEENILNVTVTCVNLNCSISSEFTDGSGKSYRIDSSSISGNDSSGYSITATVYDSEYGTLEFSASAIKFECTNGFPSSGSLSFSDGTTDVSIAFVSCDSYTLTIDGVAESLAW